MVKVVFDEAHSESWTIDTREALRISPTTPDNYYMGHLAALLKTLLDCDVQRNTDKLTASVLADTELLIVCHPCQDSVEPSLGGEANFGRDEIVALVEWVANGAGILVLGEYNVGNWGSNINDLLVQFQLTFCDDTVVASRGGDNAHLLSRHFLADVESSAKNPVVENVSSITYQRGCSISCPPEQSLIRAPAGETIVACAEKGKGRVVAIGDSDIFSIPYLGYADNALLFTNSIRWLLNQEIRSDERLDKFLEQKRFSIARFPKKKDIRSIEGDHALDCTKWVGELEQVQEKVHLDPYKTLEDFFEQAELSFHELPREIREATCKFKRAGNKYGALLLSGLPVDPAVPATPSDSRRSPSKGTYISEFWLAVFGMALGDPIAYIQQNDAEIFQNLCPVKQDQEAQSAQGSRVLLEFHTEDAFHPCRPDFLLLTCLRPDRDGKAKTTLASTQNILAEIPIRQRAMLFEPRFRTGIDYGFGNTSNDKDTGPVVPLLSGYTYDPLLTYDIDLMIGLDSEAENALTALSDAVNNIWNYVCLVPGDVLLIDNRRSIHGRTAFEPYYDGQDRWLQRLYVVRDLLLYDQERRKGERDSQRIIETLFSL